MDDNVSRTLAELEHKLDELEQALRSAVDSEPQAQAAGTSPPLSNSDGSEVRQRVGAQPKAPRAQPGTPRPGIREAGGVRNIPGAPGPVARLVDEGIENGEAKQRTSVRPSETPQAEPSDIRPSTGWRPVSQGPEQRESPSREVISTGPGAVSTGPGAVGVRPAAATPASAGARPAGTASGSAGSAAQVNVRMPGQVGAPAAGEMRPTGAGPGATPAGPGTPGGPGAARPSTAGPGAAGGPTVVRPEDARPTAVRPAAATPPSARPATAGPAAPTPASARPTTTGPAATGGPTAVRPGTAGQGTTVSGPAAGPTTGSGPAAGPTTGSGPAARPAGATPPPQGARSAQPQISGEMRLSGETIELAELVQFRERLEQLTRELVDEYSRIISLRPAPPSGRKPGE